MRKIDAVAKYAMKIALGAGGGDSGINWERAAEEMAAIYEAKVLL